MNQFYNWLAMGGYSYYVWSAYGIVCGFLVLNLISMKRQKMVTLKKLHRWFKG